MPQGSPIAQLELAAILVGVAALLVWLFRLDPKAWEARRRLLGRDEFGALMRTRPWWQRILVAAFLLVLILAAFVAMLVHKLPH